MQPLPYLHTFLSQMDTQVPPQTDIITLIKFHAEHFKSISKLYPSFIPLPVHYSEYAGPNTPTHLSASQPASPPSSTFPLSLNCHQRSNHEFINSVISNLDLDLAKRYLHTRGGKISSGIEYAIMWSKGRDRWLTWPGVLDYFLGEKDRGFQNIPTTEVGTRGYSQVRRSQLPCSMFHVQRVIGSAEMGEGERGKAAELLAV